jgi:uncharacterized membrane protein
MTSFLAAFLSSLISMLAIDGVWLTIMAKRFYAARLGEIMSQTPSLLPAGIFYLIYTFGLTVLVVLPAAANNTSLLKTYFLGALFGLAAYATYDLTNQATLKDWPFIITLVDLAWGAFLTGTVSVVSILVTKYFA